LSEDGTNPLPGDKTHVRRRRLTKSWWNDVWRDRLLVSMSFLASGTDKVAFRAGDEAPLSVNTWPLLAELPVSYEANDPPLPSDEDEEGNIIQPLYLDGHVDDLEEIEGSNSGEEETSS